MADQPSETFGQVLRRLRLDAGLTIEDLAENSGVSVRTIGNLERDTSKPRPSTLRDLVKGLGPGEQGRVWLSAAANGHPVPDRDPTLGATTQPHTLPRDINAFVGRSRERSALLGDARDGRPLAIWTISGMAGIGKTTLAVHVAHQIAGQFPDGQIFLRLNGHTPGQQPLQPQDALASLLQTVGIDAKQIPVELEDRARLWRHWLASRRILLLLDDAAGSAQVRSLLPGTATSLVLITSRANLTALESARPLELDVLAADESAHLLVLLSGRREISEDPATAQLAALCGHLPLALGIMGGQLHHNRVWQPATMAGELVAARNRLEQLHAEDTSVTAAFDLSYRDLSSAQQRLFRRLGLNPGTDTETHAAAALSDATPADTLRDLRALRDQNMITEHSYGRYRLHDLIRAYARAQASSDDPPAELDAAAERLLDFYRRTALSAAPYFARRTLSPAVSAVSPAPSDSPKIETREQAVSWMSTESVNLQAIAAYAAEVGRPHAIAIAAAVHGFLRDQGLWDQAQRMHQIALELARRQEDLLSEANALTDLGDIQYLQGNHTAAEESLTRALRLAERISDAFIETGALTEFGILRQTLGDLPSAESLLTRALTRAKSHNDRLGEANALNNLGVVHFMAADLATAEAAEKEALAIYRELGHQLGEASALNCLGGIQQATGDYDASVASLNQALVLYRDLGDRVGQAYATGNLGAVQCITADYSTAADNLRAALALYQDLGRRNGEADMLSNLGSLHRMTGNGPSAITNLNEAVALYRDLSDPFGEAGALSELGVALRETGDHRAAATALTRAAELAGEIGERADEAQALNSLGDLYVEMGMGVYAKSVYDRALRVARDIDMQSEQDRALEGIRRAGLL